MGVVVEGWVLWVVVIPPPPFPSRAPSLCFARCHVLAPSRVLAAPEAPWTALASLFFVCRKSGLTGAGVVMRLEDSERRSGRHFHCWSQWTVSR